MAEVFCFLRAAKNYCSLSFPAGGWVTTLMLPRNLTGILDHFGSGGWVSTPAEPGHALGSVARDVLSFVQHHYSVDTGQVVESVHPVRCR